MSLRTRAWWRCCTSTPSRGDFDAGEGNVGHTELGVNSRVCADGAGPANDRRVHGTEHMPDGFSPECRPRTRFLTATAEQKLLAELPADRAACVAFILATGVRWSEAVAACFEDVEQARGLVSFGGPRPSLRAASYRWVGAAIPLLDHALRYAQGKNGSLFTPCGACGATWPSLASALASTR